METLEFTAQNIKCMGCVSAIREGLQALDGVDTVDVDLQQGRVRVTGLDLSSVMIAEKMTALGYPLA